jgi:hypothetical protein
MDINALLLYLAILGGALLLYQRADRKRRFWVLAFVLLLGELTRRWAAFEALDTEYWTALAIALVLNGLFWLLIGRYNPPGTGEDIKVLGLDD